MKRLIGIASASIAFGGAIVGLGGTPAMADTAPAASAPIVIQADGPCAQRHVFPPMTVAVLNLCNHPVRFKKIYIGGSESGCSRLLNPYPSDAFNLNPFESGAIQTIRDC